MTPRPGQALPADLELLGATANHPLHGPIEVVLVQRNTRRLTSGAFHTWTDTWVRGRWHGAGRVGDFRCRVDGLALQTRQHHEPVIWETDTNRHAAYDPAKEIER